MHPAPTEPSHALKATEASGRDSRPGGGQDLLYGLSLPRLRTFCHRPSHEADHLLDCTSLEKPEAAKVARLAEYVRIAITIPLE